MEKIRKTEKAGMQQSFCLSISQYIFVSHVWDLQNKDVLLPNICFYHVMRNKLLSKTSIVLNSLCLPALVPTHILPHFIRWVKSLSLSRLLLVINTKTKKIEYRKWASTQAPLFFERYNVYTGRVFSIVPPNTTTSGKTILLNAPRLRQTSRIALCW